MSTFVLKLIGSSRFAANRDPITRMLGDRFATVDSADSSTYRYIKEIVEHKDEEGYGM